MKDKYEHDIVLVRQRARTIAALLGFDKNDQTRISTAVSEIARNAYQYAGSGEISFLVEGNDRPQIFAVQINDRGPGIENISLILEGRFRSKTGMGMGIAGAHRLMDCFNIESEKGKGTKVMLGKTIPSGAPVVSPQTAAKIADKLIKQSPENPFEEIQQQNQELLSAMSEIKQRQNQLELLNKELEDTNRGIVALYAELDEKASYLSRANEIKTRFLSNMSHEFRTPLNSIYSLSRLLLDRVDGELTTEQEKQVVYIKKAAEGLTLLVNDLLDLAKIEAGKIEVHPVEFDVKTLFSALRGMLKPLIANPEITFVIEEPECIPLMTTDEGKVSQILRNFISNSIKFTERGEIRVWAKMSENNENVIFSVSDTGIGIPPEYLEKIFEEYTQIETPLHKKAKGTGLGLPLSKKLAELIGGRISVESCPGTGSVFSAIIPVVYSEKVAVDAKTEILDPTRYPVLVIEDDETTIALYKKYLKRSEFQMLPAKTLNEARKILKEVTPEAIILDILLRGEESWNFIPEIKTNEATHDIPVFVVTVLEDANKAFACGADDFMKKPVERKWLLGRLREAVKNAPIEKVLIIDDEDVARYIMKGIFVDTKYKVIEASGGRAGLKTAEEEKPDIIFLDLMMPDMDGFETLRRLKSSKKTQDIPVIIITSKILDEKELLELNEKTLTVIPKESTSQEATLKKIRDAILKHTSKKKMEN